MIFTGIAFLFLNFLYILLLDYKNYLAEFAIYILYLTYINIIINRYI